MFVERIIDAAQVGGLCADSCNTPIVQQFFARRTLQEWEQGRKEPTGAAKALIQIVHRHPEVIQERIEG